MVSLLLNYSKFKMRGKVQKPPQHIQFNTSQKKCQRFLYTKRGILPIFCCLTKNILCILYNLCIAKSLAPWYYIDTERVSPMKN